MSVRWYRRFGLVCYSSDVLFRFDRLAYVAVYLGLSLFFSWPLLVQPYANGIGDWDQHTFYYASFLRAASYGEFPFWNPWYCGGNVLWQNPQVSLISPVYLLALLMPLALAMKLNVVAHYVVGCLGMHLLLRRVVGVTSPVVVVSLAALFAFSGGVALHLAAGHSNYLSVLWLPAIVYCFFEAAAGSRRHALGGGAIVGAAVLNAAPHLLPLAAVVLGTLGIGALAFGRRARPLIVAVAMMLAGCAYAAPKLVPAAAFARSDAFEDRRPTKHPDYMSTEMFYRAFFDPHQTKTLKISPGVQLYAWHEYGNYMGWFGAGLAAVAGVWILVFQWRARDWREQATAAAFVVMLLLSAGEFADWAPATLIRQLPFFSHFRIPSRHVMVASMFGAACIGYLLRAAQSRMERSRLVHGLIAMVCVIATVQLMLVNRKHLRDIFILPPSPIEARLLDKAAPTVAPNEPPGVEWTRLGENSMMLRSMAAGVSQLNCYEPLLARRVALPGPVAIRGDGDVRIEQTHFSPNRVAANVVVGNEPVRVLLNQNFADGWTSNVGAVERDPASTLPSVRLPAGFASTVTFTFAPRGLWLGIAVWIAALIVTVFVWWRDRHHRTVRSLPARVALARAAAMRD